MAGNAAALPAAVVLTALPLVVEDLTSTPGDPTSSYPSTIGQLGSTNSSTSSSSSFLTANHSLNHHHHENVARLAMPAERAGGESTEPHAWSVQAAVCLVATLMMVALFLMLVRAHLLFLHHLYPEVLIWP